MKATYYVVALHKFLYSLQFIGRFRSRRFHCTVLSRGSGWKPYN